jgi:hypothetical protein
MAREAGHMMLCRQGVADEPLEDEESDGLEEQHVKTMMPVIPTVKSNMGLPFPIMLKYMVYKLGPRQNGFLLAVVASIAFVLFAAVSAWSLGHAWSPPDQVPFFGDASCRFDSAEGCLAQDLFANEQVQEAAVRNIITVGRHHFSFDDLPLIRSKVAEGFRNITAEMRIRAPAIANELASVRLGKTERDAVLATLRLISDTKVQELGFEVGKAIRESTTTDRNVLFRRIMAKLLPRTDDISQLRSSVLPPGLKQIWGSGHQWNMTLHTENVQIMQAYGDSSFGMAMFDKLDDVYSAGGMDLEASDELKMVGALGGVVEEGRALISIIELCTHLYGAHGSLPLTATSLEGTLSFKSNVLSCQLGAEDEELGKPDVKNFMKAIFCPLKFGVQGLDALRALPDLVDRQPARSLFKNSRVIEVVVENIMLGSGKHGLLRPSDRELVRSMAESGLTSLSAQLEERAPNVAKELNLVPLSRMERQGILYAMSLLSDERVQTLGFGVVKAVRGGNTDERDKLEDVVKAELDGIPHEVQGLRKEFLNAWLRDTWDTAGHDWEFTLDSESIRSLRSEDTKGFNSSDAMVALGDFVLEGDRSSSMGDDLKAYAILSSIVEQGRALIDMVRLNTHLFESDLSVTSWSIAQKNTVEPELLSCTFRCSSHADAGLRLAQALTCPLRLGIYGLDTLRSYRNEA